MHEEVMGLPKSREARLFYRAAYQRYADAEFLLDQGRTTGATYLSGYSVECMLKALILAAVADTRRNEVLDSFRGRKAHDFEWLKKQYLDFGKMAIPPETTRHLARINTWSTDMRYATGTIKTREAEAFLQSVKQIITWADSRL